MTGGGGGLTLTPAPHSFCLGEFCTGSGVSVQRLHPGVFANPCSSCCRNKTGSQIQVHLPFPPHSTVYSSPLFSSLQKGKYGNPLCRHTTPDSPTLRLLGIRMPWNRKQEQHACLPTGSLSDSNTSHLTQGKETCSERDCMEGP